MASPLANTYAVLAAVALSFAPAAFAEAPLVVHYDAPAADWEREGLPIGNGAMGAMIMGGVDEERLQFNEKTLWTGGPGAAEGYDFGLPERSIAGDVASVRADLARAGRLEPEEVARRLGRETRGYGHYQSMGELVLDFADAPGDITDYRRAIDLDLGRASVSYRRNGKAYHREYFASYPDGVIAMRLLGEGDIAFTANLAVPDNRSAAFLAEESGRLIASGALYDNGLKWEAQVHVIQEGGALSAEEGAIRVVGADRAFIVLSAATDYAPVYPAYRGDDPHEGLTARMDRAVAKGYEGLSLAHDRDYRALFSRVSLDLGGDGELPATDRALAAYGAGDAGADRALEALYFQYGRYLLMSSSRAGSLPANLQGVWNHSATPPWNADYHVNINLQMNYWPAESANLSETTAPLFDFIDALIPPGRESARRIFDARGWTLSLNTNIWGFSGLIAWPTAFWQPEAGAWLAQHYYEHYRFSRDEEFLRARAYPAMKGAAEFWLDALVRDGQSGMLIVSPSYSPEHGPFSPGAAMSQQIVADLFVNTAEAARIVGDERLARRLDAARARLDPGLRIGSWGQLQEWREDGDDRGDEHRHVSHLFALHPGRQISPATTPDLAEAARVSLRARGDGGTGWSKAWKINFWARLLDGDHAHLMLAQQLRESTLPNLWDTHPPFQIDGNFGATAGIVEMLVQSQNDEIHILPALPSAWPEGQARGLRARGDCTLDIAWREGAAQQVEIECGHGGPVALRSTILAGRFEFMEAGDIWSRPLQGEGERRVFEAEPGKRYVLRVYRHPQLP